MVEALGPDQRQLRREAIEHLQQAWDAFQNSSQVQKSEINPHDELALILEGTDYTKAFRQSICATAANHKSPQEAFGLMYINLANDDLGIFEPGVEVDIERNSLADALAAAAITFHINEEATVFSFPPVHEIHSPALIPLITWADEFRDKQQDDSFVSEVEQLRPYLPPPPRLN